MIKHKIQGFTLIEIMIVVVIIAVIAAFAFPSYKNYVKRTKRIEAQSYLIELSHKLESYKLVNRSYADVSMSVINGNATFPNSANQTYTISLTDGVGVALNNVAADTRTWRLLAIPTRGQTGNGAITLTNSEQKCWYKDKDTNYTATDCKPWTAR